MFDFLNPRCKVMYPKKGEDGQPYLSRPRAKSSGDIRPNESAGQDGQPAKKRTKEPLEYLEHLRPQRATVTPTTKLLKYESEKPTPGPVKSTPRTVRSTVETAKSRMEKPSTEMVKYEPQSSVRDRHSSRASRRSEQIRQPQCRDDIRSLSHDRQSTTETNPQPLWKIRELQIAARKAQKHGGALEHHLPRESTVRRDIEMEVGGTMRQDGTDFRCGEPYGNFLEYVMKKGPPLPEDLALNGNPCYSHRTAVGPLRTRREPETANGDERIEAWRRNIEPSS